MLELPDTSCLCARPRCAHRPQFASQPAVRDACAREVTGGRPHRLCAGTRPRRLPARKQESPNGARRNLSFRGYADYMLAP